MDNIHGVKLPSASLPSVSGNDYVIVETPGGDFYWIDSSGAKLLLTVDKEHPVNSHYVQFFGDSTPAAKYGGTWEIDAEYAGRTIIGSGGNYTFGAKGGEETHTQTIDEMPNHKHDIASVTTDSGTSAVTSVLRTYTGTGNLFAQLYMGNLGGGQPFNLMQPYFVQNIWKRIA